MVTYSLTGNEGNSTSWAETMENLFMLAVYTQQESFEKNIYEEKTIKCMWVNSFTPYILLQHQNDYKIVKLVILSLKNVIQCSLPYTYIP